MGSWGVKAHESDKGLDYLGLAQNAVLKPKDYKQFDIAAVLDYLKNYIINEIRHSCRPLSEEELKQYKANNLSIPNGTALLMLCASY